MITRIVFYLGESFLLALVVGVALIIAARGLRRLGLDVEVRRLVTFLAIWGALFALGLLGGELAGPEFLAAYRLTGLLAASAIVFWIASIPLSRVIYIRFRENDR